MDFEPTEEQKLIADLARRIAKDFGPDYWMEREETKEFGQEFWDALVRADFHRLIIPEKYGGMGAGMQELIIAMEELCAGGCGMAGAWYLVLSEVFGALPIAMLGTEEQKEKYLKGKLAKGKEWCMALTEPDAGTNTLNTKTFAKADGDGYVINGQKIFISGADRACGMTLITRTTPIEEVSKPSLGLSLFILDLPNPSVEIRNIPKHGINYCNTFEVFIEDVKVPKENLLGQKEKGWYNVANSILNPERMSFAAAATGIGRLALETAVEYVKKREVFGRPIGQHQAIQFPLAEAKARIEAARILNQKACWLFDQGKPSMNEANLAKVCAVEAGMHAVYHAMQAHGGYGYATEYHVERWWREVNLIRLAPVTHQMALAFIGEHVMGMPKSY